VVIEWIHCLVELFTPKTCVSFYIMRLLTLRLRWIIII